MSSASLGIAATFALEPVADARVISYGGALDVSNYATDFLSVYTMAGNVQRTFLQFDLSGIALASNERVESAVLTLTASTAWGGNTGRAMEVYRVVAPWSEQSLSWLRRMGSTPWGTPGGDLAGDGGQAYAVSTHSPANNEPVSWDLTRLVEEWVEGFTPNYGMLLKSYNGNALTFVQRESPVVAARPALTITTGPGVPLLKGELDPGTGQVVLSWRGDAAVLQYRAMADGGGWTDSALPVSPEGARSVVRHNPGATGTSFFRLRSKP